MVLRADRRRSCHPGRSAAGSARDTITLRNPLSNPLTSLVSSQTEMTVSLEVSEKELQELTRLATTYALAHGLLYLPVGDIQPPAPTSAIHAPLAIFPTSFPRSKFLLAQKLQPLYNVLYARVATDEKFLDGVMGAVEGVGKVDRFTGQLWNCWKQLRDEGIQQVRDKDFIEHLF